MNPELFLALAEAQMPKPRQARQCAAEKRAARKTAERQAAEREQLNVAWRRWRNERREKLLAGPYGDSFRSLIDFLESMTLESGAALVAAVEAGPWGRADASTKFEVLALIDAAVIALRERNGLPPFDDPLPGNQPNAFLALREMLT